MKLKDQIIFWIVFVFLFLSCVQSVFGFLVFAGLIAIFRKGLIRFYKGDWFKIQ